jgi:hypothetical protein
MKRVEKELESGKSLLSIDNDSCLHQADRILDLLQYYSAQKVWLRFVMWVV